MLQHAGYADPAREPAYRHHFPHGRRLRGHLQEPSVGEDHVDARLLGHVAPVHGVAARDVPQQRLALAEAQAVAIGALLLVSIGVFGFRRGGSPSAGGPLFCCMHNVPIGVSELPRRLQLRHVDDRAASKRIISGDVSSFFITNQFAKVAKAANYGLAKASFMRPA